MLILQHKGFTPCAALFYYIEKSNLLENYTTYKIHTKLHPGPKWCILHILTSEDIDDVISHFFTVVCANSQ